jgi:hypothetical protein
VEKMKNKLFASISVMIALVGCVSGVRPTGVELTATSPSVAVWTPTVSTQSALASPTASQGSSPVLPSWGTSEGCVTLDLSHPNNIQLDGVAVV